MEITKQTIKEKLSEEFEGSSYSPYSTFADIGKKAVELFQGSPFSPHIDFSRGDNPSEVKLTYKRVPFARINVRKVRGRCNPSLFGGWTYEWSIREIEVFGPDDFDKAFSAIDASVAEEERKRSELFRRSCELWSMLWEKWPGASDEELEEVLKSASRRSREIRALINGEKG